MQIYIFSVYTYIHRHTEVGMVGQSINVPDNDYSLWHEALILQEALRDVCTPPSSHVYY